MTTTPTTPAQTKPDTSGQIVYDTRAALAAVYEPLREEVERINAALADLSAFVEDLKTFEPTEANVTGENLPAARKRFLAGQRLLYRLCPHHDGEKYPDEPMLDPQTLWRRVQEMEACLRGICNQFDNREKQLKAIVQEESARRRRAAEYLGAEAAEEARKERLRRGELA